MTQVYVMEGQYDDKSVFNTLRAGEITIKMVTKSWKNQRCLSKALDLGEGYLGSSLGREIVGGGRRRGYCYWGSL